MKHLIYLIMAVMLAVEVLCEENNPHNNKQEGSEHDNGPHDNQYSFQNDQHASVHSVWTPRTRTAPSYKCIAVLTGYPELQYLHYFIERILMQLSHKFDVDPRHVHVFCQGHCSADSFNNVFHYNFYSLHNTVDRSLYRGFIIAENYKLMFNLLFNSKNSKPDYCLILEDDLVLSPDALDYLNAAVGIMESDATIFTASLYNDNAYPWCASNTSFFRRIDHFSGLGFIMSKKWYRDLVIPNWNDDNVWDHNLQEVTARFNMSSIQPEVNRVLHAPYKDVISTSENQRRQFSRYTAHVATETCHLPYNLEYLQKGAYDQFMIKFIESASVIQNLEDAGFYKPGDQLLYLGCKDERPCMDSLLQDHGLSGAGLGFMVRGAYHGTVFLRVYNVLVLIIPRSSQFFSYVSDAQLQVGDVFPVSAPGFAHLDSISRKSKGTVAHIESQYRIVVASDNHDCFRLCQSHALECSRAGLWLLNHRCEILQHFVEDCTKCDDSDIKHIRSGPMIERRKEGNVCLLARSNFHLQCHGGGVGGHRRICTCS